MNKVMASVLAGCMALGLAGCGTDDNLRMRSMNQSGTGIYNTGTPDLFDTNGYYRNQYLNHYNNYYRYPNNMRGKGLTDGSGTQRELYMDLNNNGVNDLGRLENGYNGGAGPMNRFDHTRMYAPGSTDFSTSGTGMNGTVPNGTTSSGTTGSNGSVSGGVTNGNMTTIGGSIAP